MLVRRFRNWVAGIGSMLTGYEVAHLFWIHERSLGLYCPPKVCGADELPFYVFVIVYAVLYYSWVKIRDWS